MPWITGADGQPNVTGSTLVLTGYDGNGNPIYSGNPGTPGFDVIIDQTLITPLPAWASYQVTPPLTRTWAGEDPANPITTLQYQFPDAATAQSVMSTLWTTP